MNTATSSPTLTPVFNPSALPAASTTGIPVSFDLAFEITTRGRDDGPPKILFALAVGIWICTLTSTRILLFPGTLRVWSPLATGFRQETTSILWATISVSASFLMTLGTTAIGQSSSVGPVFGESAGIAGGGPPFCGGLKGLGRSGQGAGAAEVHEQRSAVPDAHDLDELAFCEVSEGALFPTSARTR